MEWNAESFTPAGEDTFGRLVQIRVFDCWSHEQDIRDGMGLPGRVAGLAVDVTLDELTTALGFVARTIHVEVGEREAVAPALAGPATVTLRMPVRVMTRPCAGQVVGVCSRTVVGVRIRLVCREPAVARR